MTSAGQRSDFLGPVWVYLLAFILFFLRFGYGFALGDQDEFVPFILHQLDPSLLANDWFVNTQAGFSVRTMFIALLLPFCRPFAVADVALAFYLGLWFVIAVGAYRLLRVFEIDRIASAGAVLLSLGVLHKWTLGSNDLVYTMLVPEMVAWALALPAVEVFVRRSPRRLMDRGSGTGQGYLVPAKARIQKGRRQKSEGLDSHLRGNDGLRGNDLLWPILLAVAAWYQVLVGILVFGCLFVIRIRDLWRVRRLSSSWPRLAVPLIVFVIAALPVVAPIVSSQMRSPDVGDGPSIFYILAPFRNPIHHMLLSFPTKSVIRFAIMTIAAVGSLTWLNRKGLIRHATFLLRLGTLILLGCVVMFLSTEIYPVLFVAKLQLYKLTVLFKLLAVGLIGAVFIPLLPAGLVAFGESLLRPGLRRFMISGCLLVAVSIVWIAKPDLVDQRRMLKTHVESDLGMMEQWIADNTERSAVFAIPPSNSTFRSNARRAIVVNFMAFPYKDPEMVEWFRRIQSVAPIGQPESGLFIRPELDYAFENLEADDLRGLAQQYGVEYVLRQTPLEESERVKSIGDWTLYRIG